MKGQRNRICVFTIGSWEWLGRAGDRHDRSEGRGVGQGRYRSERDGHRSGETGAGIGVGTGGVTGAMIGIEMSYWPCFCSEPPVHCTLAECSTSHRCLLQRWAVWWFNPRPAGIWLVLHVLLEGGGAKGPPTSPKLLDRFPNFKRRSIALYVNYPNKVKNLTWRSVLTSEVMSKSKYSTFRKRWAWRAKYRS